jgi:hypothetical protein
MITIRITNPDDVVRRQKGAVVAAVGGLFVDLADKVEAAVADQVRAALAANGVEALVERVPDPR